MGKELIFTGRMADAREALRIGLVNHVVPHETLMKDALALAERIAENGQLAVRSCKELVNIATDVDLHSGLEKETGAFGACFSTEDQEEGMDAFLHKRTPEFKGR
jgi:enoyl-CoA hydratase